MDSGGRGPRGVAEEVREAVAKVRASGRPLLGDRELRAEGMASPRAYGRSMPGSSEQQQRGVSARVPDRLITRHHVQLAKGAMAAAEVRVVASGPEHAHWPSPSAK